MKMSRSTGYALIALGYIAKYTDKPTVLATEISVKYDIPLDYLMKIMHQLFEIGILNRKRGLQRGFSLARKPEKITMLEIIEAIDGPLASQLHVAEQTKDERFALNMEAACRQATEALRAVLQKTTLAKIIQSLDRK